MADILAFPDPRATPRRLPEYRAYHFNRSGSIETAHPIQAASDSQASQHARALANLHGIELWDRARFIARFGPPDEPVASGIKLIDPAPRE